MSTDYITKEYGNGIVGRIVVDPDPVPYHAYGATLGQIVYLKKSRDCLGTHPVTEDEMDSIAEEIRNGTLIGLPVYAYVHINEWGW
jgi:hypothetical protein